MWYPTRARPTPPRFWLLFPFFLIFIVLWGFIFFVWGRCAAQGRLFRFDGLWGLRGPTPRGYFLYGQKVTKKPPEPMVLDSFTRGRPLGRPPRRGFLGHAPKRRAAVPREQVNPTGF